MNATIRSILLTLAGGCALWSTSLSATPITITFDVSFYSRYNISGTTSFRLTRDRQFSGFTQQLTVVLDPVLDSTFETVIAGFYAVRKTNFGGPLSISPGENPEVLAYKPSGLPSPSLLGGIQLEDELSYTTTPPAGSSRLTIGQGINQSLLSSSGLTKRNWIYRRDISADFDLGGNRAVSDLQFFTRDELLSLLVERWDTGAGFRVTERGYSSTTKLFGRLRTGSYSGVELRGLGTISSLSFQQVPEPASLPLILFGLVLLRSAVASRSRRFPGTAVGTGCP